MAKKEKLTTKQKKFCHQYVIDFNGSAAAIRAGYSKRTAKVSAHENLTKHYLRAYLSKLLVKQEARSEKTADDVIAQLTKISFADVKKYMSWDNSGVTLKGSSNVDGTLLQEISVTETKRATYTKLKLSDRLKALELLGKHFGLFADELKIPEGIEITHRWADEKN